MRNESHKTWLLVVLMGWLVGAGIAEDLARRPTFPPTSLGVHLASQRAR